MERFDLIVIGAGPAGEKGAAQAAYFGKRVAIVERAPEPGGAGVHTGTLPSKTLREAAVFLSGQKARSLYGITSLIDPQTTLHRLMARKDVIAASESLRIRQNLAEHGVRYFEGVARLEGPHTVGVQTAAGPLSLQAEYILIATGSRPTQPQGVSFADPRIHDSDEILTISELPASLTVLGAGVIGCEYACMFAALGVHVTLVDVRETILPFLDHEIAERLLTAMRSAGIEFVTNRRWTHVTTDRQMVHTHFADGGELHSAHLLYCAGRSAATEGLGLAELGVQVGERGHLKVDADYRTSLPSIFAAGDVIGFPGLASAAMEQARVAVCKAFGFGYKTAVSSLIPFGIYTIPAVSAVGETEQSCVKKQIDCVVGRAPYSQNARAKIIGDLNGLLKLVVEVPTKRLLGVHVIGERATELVHIGQAVIHLQGSVEVFVDMVWNFPTLAEIYKYAAYDSLDTLARRN